jgi:hypothetical protein
VMVRVRLVDCLLEDAPHDLTARARWEEA